ncbi:MAG: hypothetical protein KGD65_13885 [Candidatus Lokiarchaeota archaeon]|nr:hypothetical protein [Candidatus Lokiarchaeota archaeon]
MNAKERYLAIFDDNKRKKLDRVPTFVQYIRQEFVELHKQKFENIGCLSSQIFPDLRMHI